MAKPSDEIAAAQEWCVRLELRYFITNELGRWLLRSGHMKQPDVWNNNRLVEIRAPRGVALTMTKSWAEQYAREALELGLATSAEAVPLWL